MHAQYCLIMKAKHVTRSLQAMLLALIYTFRTEEAQRDLATVAPSAMHDR